MLTTGPTVIRAALPYPDAAIIRQPDGRMYVVVDESWSEEDIAKCVREAPHCRDGRPFPT